MELTLNADLGESFGAWKMGDDGAMLGIVDSASIACGFHAGDPLIMRRTLHAAKRNGVSVGAHPSFPDLQGFGRRRMQLPADELQAMILYQLGALAAMAEVEGLQVTHVKPHGALSNMACEDAALALRVVRAIKSRSTELILLAPAASHLAQAGEREGLRVAAELFADRAYADDGSLLPRARPGALLSESDACVAHVMAMIEAQGIVTASGKIIPTPIHTICVHGDQPQAVATARTLRTALKRAGCALKALPELAVLR